MQGLTGLEGPKRGNIADSRKWGPKLLFTAFPQTHTSIQCPFFSTSTTYFWTYSENWVTEFRQNEYQQTLGNKLVKCLNTKDYFPESAIPHTTLVFDLKFLLIIPILNMFLTLFLVDLQPGIWTQGKKFPG